jgi:hypothetical protein
MNQTHYVAVTRTAHQNRTVDRRFLADQHSRARKGLTKRPGKRPGKTDENDESRASALD